MPQIRVDAMIAHGVEDRLFLPGNGRTEWFKDCEHGPEMVVIPPGEFWMGAGPEEPKMEYEFSELPRHLVSIRYPLAVGRFAVTWDEWDIAAAAGGVTPMRDNFGLGRGRRPVIEIGWEDAKSYCAWLTRITGKAYRLLSEAEWEYACRAGTTTCYWWGDDISETQANFMPARIEYASDEYRARLRILPVDSFEPNPWGLYQMHGNVWEWVEDSAHPTTRQGTHTYEGAPADGSAWLGGYEEIRIVRGGSFGMSEDWLRSACRSGDGTESGMIHHGFRIARDL